MCVLGYLVSFCSCDGFLDIVFSVEKFLFNINYANSVEPEYSICLLKQIIKEKNKESG